MRISVVLPSYNSEQYLPKTLTSLSNQDFAGEYEILVIDCSQGDQVERICASFPRVRFHREAERFNPGTGRNIGARLATGRLLVFLDTDVSLMSNALQQAWDYYEQGNKIFGGALELDRGASPSIASYLEHYFFNHESQQRRPTCARSNLSSALMLFDRELFLAQGGFSNIPRMQDTELTERVTRAGHTLTFRPSVVGLQIQDSPMDKVLKKILINGKNLYFIRYANSSWPRKVGFFLLLPVVSGAKVSRIVARHLRYQDAHGRMMTVALTPFLLWGGCYWMAGFYQSLIFGGGISSRRD
jgi:glycosyltransferase involved in cell wall biosynthesis